MQSIIRVLVTCAVAACLSISIISAPASAVTRATTSAAVTVSATTVLPYQAVVVSGILKKGTRVFPSARVSLQFRLNGAVSWSLLKTAVTNSTGRISTTVRPMRNHEFRLVFAGGSTVSPAASPARDVYVRQSATITKTSAASVDAGAPVTLSGTTSAALAGRPATLQVKSGTTWKIITSGKVSATRTFSLSTKATGRGNQYYRVVVSGTASATTAISATKTFKVYAWYALEKVMAFHPQGLVPQTNWRIAGTTYPLVLGAYNRQSSHTAYTYGGQCRTLKAAVGVMDLAYYGSSFGAWTDKREADFGSMEPGQAPRQVSMDLTGSDYVVLWTGGGYSMTNGFYPAYIGARISCVTEPGYFIL